jgi:hypothetical protein
MAKAKKKKKLQEESTTQERDFTVYPSFDMSETGSKIFNKMPL